MKKQNNTNTDSDKPYINLVLPPIPQKMKNISQIVHGKLKIEVGVLNLSKINQNNIEIITKFWGEPGKGNSIFPVNKNNLPNTLTYQILCPIIQFQKYLLDMKNLKFLLLNERKQVIGTCTIPFNTFIPGKISDEMSHLFQDFSEIFPVNEKTNQQIEQKIGELELGMSCHFDKPNRQESNKKLTSQIEDSQMLQSSVSELSEKTEQEIEVNINKENIDSNLSVVSLPTKNNNDPIEEIEILHIENLFQNFSQNKQNVKNILDVQHDEQISFHSKFVEYNIPSLQDVEDFIKEETKLLESEINTNPIQKETIQPVKEFDQSLLNADTLTLNIIDFHCINEEFKQRIEQRNLFIDVFNPCLQQNQHDDIAFDSLKIFCNNKNGESFLFQQEISFKFQLNENNLEQIFSNSIIFKLNTFILPQQQDQNEKPKHFMMEIATGQLKFKKILKQKIQSEATFYINMMSKIPTNSIKQSSNIQNNQNSCLIKLNKNQFQKKKCEQENLIGQISVQIQFQQKNNRFQPVQIIQQQQQNLYQQIQLDINFQLLLKLGKINLIDKQKGIQFNIYCRYKIYGTQESVESNLIWYNDNIDLEHKMIIPISLSTIRKMSKYPFIIEIWTKDSENSKLLGLIKLNLQTISKLALDGENFNQNFVSANQLLILHNEQLFIQDIRGKDKATLFVLLAFGSPSQVSKYENQQLQENKKLSDYQTTNRTFHEQSQIINSSPKKSDRFSLLQIPTSQTDMSEQQISQYVQNSSQVIEQFITLFQNMYKIESKIRNQLLKYFDKQQSTKEQFIQFFFEQNNFDLSQNNLLVIWEFLTFFSGKQNIDLKQCYLNFLNCYKQAKISCQDLFKKFDYYVDKSQIKINQVEMELNRISEFGLLKKDKFLNYLNNLNIKDVDSQIILDISDNLDLLSDGYVTISLLFDYLKQYKGEFKEFQLSMIKYYEQIKNYLSKYITSIKCTENEMLNIQKCQEFINQNLELNFSISSLDTLLIMEFLTCKQQGNNFCQWKINSAIIDEWLEKTLQKNQQKNIQNTEKSQIQQDQIIIQKNEQNQQQLSQQKQNSDYEQDEIEDLNSILNNKQQDINQILDNYKITLRIKSLSNLVLNEYFDAKQISIKYQMQNDHLETNNIEYINNKKNYTIDYQSINIYKLRQKDNLENILYNPSKEITFNLLKKPQTVIASSNFPLKKIIKNFNNNKNKEQYELPLKVNDYFSGQFPDKIIGTLIIEVILEKKTDVQSQNQEEILIEKEVHIERNIPKQGFLGLQLKATTKIPQFYQKFNNISSQIKLNLFSNDEYLQTIIKPFVSQIQYDQLEPEFIMQEERQITLNQDIINYFQNDLAKIELLICNLEENNTSRQIGFQQFDLMNLILGETINEKLILQDQDEFRGQIDLQLSYSQKSILKNLKKNGYLIYFKLEQILMDDEYLEQNSINLKFQTKNQKIILQEKIISLKKQENKLHDLYFKILLVGDTELNNHRIVDIDIFNQSNNSRLGQLRFDLSEIINKNQQQIGRKYMSVSQSKIRMKFQIYFFKIENEKQIQTVDHYICSLIHDKNTSIIKEQNIIKLNENEETIIKGDILPQKFQQFFQYYFSNLSNLRIFKKNLDQFIDICKLYDFDNNGFICKDYYKENIQKFKENEIVQKILEFYNYILEQNQFINDKSIDIYSFDYYLLFSLFYDNIMVKLNSLEQEQKLYEQKIAQQQEEQRKLIELEKQMNESWTLKIQLIEGQNFHNLLNKINPNSLIKCTTYNFQTKVIMREMNPQFDFNFSIDILRKNLPNTIDFIILHQSYNKDFRSELHSYEQIGKFQLELNLQKQLSKNQFNISQQPIKIFDKYGNSTEASIVIDLSLSNQDIQQQSFDLFNQREQILSPIKQQQEQSEINFLEHLDNGNFNLINNKDVISNFHKTLQELAIQNDQENYQTINNYKYDVNNCFTQNQLNSNHIQDYQYEQNTNYNTIQDAMKNIDEMHQDIIKLNQDEQEINQNILFKSDLNFTKKINPFEDNLEKLASPETNRNNKLVSKQYDYDQQKNIISKNPIQKKIQNNSLRNSQELDRIANIMKQNYVPQKMFSDSDSDSD